MPNLTLQTKFDVADLLLGAFGAASVNATASSVSYTLGTKVLALAGSFTVSGGLPVSGSISSLSYAIDGASQFKVSSAGWSFAQFESALANDSFAALLAGGDRVTGTAAADTLRGQAGDDLLRGGSGADTLQGSYGNDTLDGGTSADSMQGGSGDDVYRVDHSSDRMVEYAGGGADRVDTRLSSLTLAKYVDNLDYLGSSNFTGTGNGEANHIAGGKGADRLSGLGGNDVLRGGNGNDVLDGGAGDDRLVGDAGGASVTTAASRPSSTADDLRLSVSMTIAEVATSTSATVSGHISNASLATGVFNLAFVVDVSSSMSNTFGPKVGDVNGDGAANTYLDAAIASFKALVASINAAGLGENVRIALIPFDSESDIRAIGSGKSDANANGTADVVDAALGLDEFYGAHYDRGLQNAVRFFDASPKGDNHVFFLSASEPTGGPYEGFLDTLRSASGINAKIRALGINADSRGYYDVLDKLDDGEVNDSAIDVLDPSGLTAGLLSARVDLADVKHLEIYRNGTLLTTLTASQLTETPFGLRYAYTVTDLSATGTDQIETRLVLKDPGASVITTSRAISVGTLASDDSLVGGSGNDTLDGGAGVDTLVGGTGDDAYRVDSTGDHLVEAAGAGHDRVEAQVSFSLNSTAAAQIEDLLLLGSRNTSATGNALANVVQGNTGNNVIQGLGGDDTLDGGFGTDTVSYASAVRAVTVDLATGTAASGRETDTLGGFEAVRGSRYGDNLTGDDFDNRFVGGAGNDVIKGMNGLDTVDYSAATSAVTVALDVDVRGGTGRSADAAEGVDILLLVEGVLGSKYDDAISDRNHFNMQANRFDGGEGNDTLRGGYGADTLLGGSGNDVLHGGAPYWTTDPEIDVVDYSGSTAAISGRMVGAMTGTAIGTDTLSHFEQIIATAYADSIGGGTASELFEGGAGNDTLRGGAGNDTLLGGIGADSMAGGADDDLYVLNSTGDKVVEMADQGEDSVQSSVTHTLGTYLEHLSLVGRSAVDGTGNSAANRLVGNDAANLLTSLGGNDTVDAGAGNDTVLGGEGADFLDGGMGIDVLSFAGSASAVSGTLDGTFSNNSGTDRVAGFEHIIGSTYGDNLTGESFENRIEGGRGHDTLAGGHGNDTLVGGAGNDVLDGGVGVDSISYAYLTRGITADLSTGVIVGDGTDTILDFSVERISGTSYADVISWTDASIYTFTGLDLVGGAGNDQLQGSSAGDTLNGGSGADTMAGGGGDDTYLVSASTDVVTEAQYEGTDTVQSSISYTLRAEVENLTLAGKALNGYGNGLSNLVTGNALANSLRGYSGGDTLVGGLGADTLDGGLDSGYDVFSYSSAADSRGTAGDLIRNFNVAYDAFDLTRVDAEDAAAGTQSFEYIGTSKFSGVAGQLRYQAGSASTTLYGDTNGDKLADFSVVLEGNHALTASDFYL